MMNDEFGADAHGAGRVVETPVILSTATSAGDAYSLNDGADPRHVILSERSESKNPPKFGVKLDVGRRYRPSGTCKTIEAIDAESFTISPGDFDVDPPATDRAMKESK